MVVMVAVTWAIITITAIRTIAIIRNIGKESIIEVICFIVYCVMAKQITKQGFAQCILEVRKQEKE